MSLYLYISYNCPWTWPMKVTMVLSEVANEIWDDSLVFLSSPIRVLNSFRHWLISMYGSYGELGFVFEVFLHSDGITTTIEQ